MRRLMKISPLTLVILLLVGAAVTGCGANTAEETNHRFELAPLTEMSQAVQDAPVVVQEAYQFAVANPDVTTQIPCYCGCGGMGHTSNYTCFVADDSVSAGLKNETITLVLALEVEGGSVRITAQVRDWEADNAVLWERTVVDTPAEDPFAAPVARGPKSFDLDSLSVVVGGGVLCVGGFFVFAGGRAGQGEGRPFDGGWALDGGRAVIGALVFSIIGTLVFTIVVEEQPERFAFGAIPQFLALGPLDAIGPFEKFFPIAIT